jgi:uncharacterized protein
MICPVCQSQMQRAGREGVEIDYCPNCRGVWLDRGELDKIIERARTEVPQSRSPRRGRAAQVPNLRSKYSQFDNQQARQERKDKKKSFLDEIFDFF